MAELQLKIVEALRNHCLGLNQQSQQSQQTLQSQSSSGLSTGSSGFLYSHQLSSTGPLPVSTGCSPKFEATYSPFSFPCEYKPPLTLAAPSSGPCFPLLAQTGQTALTALTALTAQTPQLLAPPRALSPASLCTSYTLTRSPSLLSAAQPISLISSVHSASTSSTSPPVSTTFSLSQQPPILFSRILGKLPDLRSLSELFSQNFYRLRLQGFVFGPPLEFLQVANSAQGTAAGQPFSL